MGADVEATAQTTSNLGQKVNWTDPPTRFLSNIINMDSMSQIPGDNRALVRVQLQYGNHVEWFRHDRGMFPDVK